MTQKSDEYEKLVRDIHQSLLREDGVEHVQVQHNVKIKGKSGASHQIDIYWEFQLAGVLYRTCIECKDYKDKVTKIQVAAFAKTIEDIGRNVNGIIATTEGFQKGAKQLAEHNNIRLVLVNYLIKTIALQYTFKISQIKDFTFNFDKEYSRKVLLKAGVSSFSVNVVNTLEAIFFSDENGNQTISLKELMSGKENIPGEYEIPLNNVYYSTEIGIVKLNSITFKVFHHEIQREDMITTNDISRAVLEDVITNHKQYLNDDGSISV